MFYLWVIPILISCVGHGNLLPFWGDETVTAFYYFRVRTKLEQSTVQYLLFSNFIVYFRISFSNNDTKKTSSIKNYANIARYWFGLYDKDYGQLSSVSYTIIM